MSSENIKTTEFMECNFGCVDLATKHNTGQQMFTDIMLPK